MRNLAKLPPPFIDYYDAAVQKRQRQIRDALVRRRPSIQNAFDEYEARLAIDALGEISPLKLRTSTKEHLRYCYDAERNELYSMIKGNQHGEPKTRCQYCGIGEATTLDHYIPRDQYPEFSVFILNLVLACAHCNNKKLNVWRDNGETVFIHLYHDELELNQFLSCSVVLRNGEFVPDFRLVNLGAISQSLFRRIEEHFRRLQLFTRFVECSVTYVTEVRNNLLASQFMFTRTQKRGLLQRQAALIGRTYGLNNWRTALHEGLAGCAAYLDSASSPYGILTSKWLRHKLSGKV
jgi:5-methylcytosine-specific restriction endonuclease McrA